MNSAQISGTTASLPKGRPGPSYEFWVLAPGSSTWQPARPYGTNATYNWTTAGNAPGTYHFSVWARDASSPGTFTNSLGSYDAFNASLFYTLTSTACTSVGLSASPASPDMVGTPVTVSASPFGCPNPTYEFWILPPGSSTWQPARGYASASSYGWTTTGKPAEMYRFSVWIRDAASSGTYTNSLGSYDAFNSGLTFTLTLGCSAMSQSASPPSPGASGTPVTFTATASGCLNASPVFEFWILAPGATAWQPAQPYSTTTSFGWTTTGKPAGTYHFSVWVRDSSSAGAYTNSLGSYDAFNSGQYFTLN